MCLTEPVAPRQRGKEAEWFVMRDLKRPNAKLPAYQLLEDKHVRVFTPKRWCVTERGGRKVRREMPIIPDLLFVYDTRERLDTIVAVTPTLQYRWLVNTYREPMTVPLSDMERFIRAW